MKKIVSFIMLFGFLLFSSQLVQAQYENTSEKKQEGKVNKKQQQPKVNRWFAGGMIGAGFSSYSSYVEVSPLVGYKVTSDFHVGTRLTYIYNGFRYCDNCPKYNTHNYGGSLFARYIFLRFLMAHVEYELLSRNYFDRNDVSQRITISSLFLGGGIYQSIGGKGFMSFMILFNVLDNEYSPYANPMFRIGFGMGF